MTMSDEDTDMPEKYSYITQMTDTGGQYSREELDHGIVDAKYVRMRGYEGNPYIEALPHGYTIAEMKVVFNVPASVPSPKELAEMDEYEREDSVDAMSDFRIMLPFHALIERQFHRTLIQSYHKRKIQENERINVNVTVEDEPMVTHAQMVPKNMSEPVSGFTLLGIGGCGKSTGLNMVLNHYPQTIIHDRESWQRRVQIVYLLVHCTPNSNFSKLYENIGESIDYALGNFNETYKLQFRRGSLGDKYDLLKQLIKRFAIGAIILDEIELMDIKSTKESSFETFLALTNETGVAVCVVGTMDAYSKLFGKARTARRCGVNIIANRYCYNQKMFKQIVSLMQIYHWTPNLVDYAGNEKLLDALYQTSHGVISDLVEIYKMIQKDQLRKPTDITADYIRNIAKRYFEILERARTLEEQTIDNEAASLSFDELSRLNTAQERLEEENVNRQYQEVISDPAVEKYMLLQSEVLEAIRAGHYGYRVGEIERAFSVVMRRPESTLDMPLAETVKKVLVYLNDRHEEAEIKRNRADRDKIDLKKLQDDLLQNNKKQEA